jgi:hypothetical protein
MPVISTRIWSPTRAGREVVIVRAEVLVRLAAALPGRHDGAARHEFQRDSPLVDGIRE